MSYNGITVKVGTISPSLVEPVSRLVFLSFMDLSDTGADAATLSLTKAVIYDKLWGAQTVLS